jgi:hypothetical protein
MIHIGQAILKLGGGLDYFLNTVFNYPTLAECYKMPVLNTSNKLQKGTRVAPRRWRARIYIRFFVGRPFRTN